MELSVGSVVISKAGRDKSKFLAVIKIDDAGVYVCDGKERPLENPKRKNPIHLAVTNYRVTPQEMETNRSLKRVLKQFDP